MIQWVETRLFRENDGELVWTAEAVASLIGQQVPIKVSDRLYSHAVIRNAELRDGWVVATFEMTNAPD